MRFLPNINKTALKLTAKIIIWSNACKRCVFSIDTSNPVYWAVFGSSDHNTVWWLDQKMFSLRHPQLHKHFCEFLLSDWYGHDLKCLKGIVSPQKDILKNKQHYLSLFIFKSYWFSPIEESESYRERVNDDRIFISGWTFTI